MIHIMCSHCGKCWGSRRWHTTECYILKTSTWCCVPNTKNHRGPLTKTRTPQCHAGQLYLIDFDGASITPGLSVWFRAVARTCMSDEFKNGVVHVAPVCLCVYRCLQAIVAGNHGQLCLAWVWCGYAAAMIPSQGTRPFRRSVSASMTARSMSAWGEACCTCSHHTRLI